MAYPFERMTTKKLNSYFEKRADTDGKKRKQTSAGRYQLEKNRKQTVPSYPDILDQATVRDKLIVP